MTNHDKVNKIILGSIAFRAERPKAFGGGDPTNYNNAVANCCRGVSDLIEVSRAILRRLDIEAAERGQDAPFLCNAYRDILREAIRGCDGKDARKTIAPSA